MQKRSRREGEKKQKQMQKRTEERGEASISRSEEERILDVEQDHTNCIPIDEVLSRASNTSNEAMLKNFAAASGCSDSISEKKRETLSKRRSRFLVHTNEHPHD